MAIPSFQDVMLPLLRLLDAGESDNQQTIDALATHYALTPEEIAVKLPSGKQGLFRNKVAWAKSHMKAAGLIESPQKGTYRITQRGRDVLASNPPAINMALLAKFPEYVVFRQGSGGNSTPVLPSVTTSSTEERTPDDLLEDGYTQLRAALVADLKEMIAKMSPAAFEQLVVDLLKAMGYGGPQDDAGLVVGGGGDEGIDGVIREDRLGLETIYIQAKRWQKTVGRPDIQQFAGALQGQRAKKGVFITASGFSKEAIAYAGALSTTIVLLDGSQLAELMIDHGVGVTTVKTFEIKRLDSDYFSAE